MKTWIFTRYDLKHAISCASQVYLNDKPICKDQIPLYKYIVESYIIGKEVFLLI